MGHGVESVTAVKLCEPPRPVLIEKSTLGNHAALAGGASVALSRLHLSLFTEGLKGVEIAVPPPSIETFKKGAA